MGLQPIGFLSGTLLIIGLLIAIVFAVSGVLGTKNTGSMRRSLIGLVFALIIAAITLAVALFVPECLLLSMLVVIMGLMVSWQGLFTTPISKPGSTRGRAFYVFAHALGGQTGIHVMYVAIGLLLILCGLIGLLNYFGLY
jgi:hypothetical protein